MRFRFKTRKLEQLYHCERGAQRYPPGVVDAFFEVMLIIESAVDERDFYGNKSLHYELLSGPRRRKHQHSMRLNEQYRLTLTLESDGEGKYCYIMEISDHYRP